MKYVRPTKDFKKFKTLYHSIDIPQPLSFTLLSSITNVKYLLKFICIQKVLLQFLLLAKFFQRNRARTRSFLLFALRTRFFQRNQTKYSATPISKV